MALLLGCSEPTTPPVVAGLEIVHGAPAEGEMAAPDAQHATANPVAGIAAFGSLVVVAADEEVFMASDATLTPLELWTDEAPFEVGSVQWVAPGRSSVLVSADNGVFHTHGPRLLRSPVSASLDEEQLVGAVADRGALWLLGARGIGRLDEMGTTWHSVPAESEPPSAAHPFEGGLVAAYEDRVYELDLERGSLTRVPHMSGRVFAMSRGDDGAVHIATERGIFERSAEGAYRQYTLAAEDEDPVSVTGLAHYPKDGTFALTADGVALLRDGATWVVDDTSVDGATHLAADGIGGLWLGSDSGVTRWPVGTAIGFAADVRPILEAKCDSCHAAGTNGAPSRDLLDYASVTALADSILARLIARQMPPAGAESLTGTELDTVVTWNLNGRQP